jgi:EAL and modified HD-GYP domain-containing signal transduction protein
MQVFVARQPIFTRHRNVYGYELLFRSGLENFFDGLDGGAASMHVIDNSFFVLGLSTMTAGAKAFINFTRETLLEGYARLLPPTSLVVEILEDVEPDDQVVKACRDLKSAGYRLALDDYVLLHDRHPLIPLVDIIKVDFLQLTDEERRALPRIISSHHSFFLAEKVETEDDFALAVDAGYSYLQGYFFSKPTIITGHKPEGFRMNHLQILEEVRKPEINFTKLEELIKRETSLVYRILRHVNSASFGLWNKVISVKHALLLMGGENVRRLICLLVLGDMIGDRPTELIRTAAARANFCEAIAGAARWTSKESELFLLGLFSMLEAIMMVPIEEALEGLPLPDDVVHALRGEENPYRVVYDLMIGCERGDWSAVDCCADSLGIPQPVVAQAYYRSIEWAQSVLK